MESYVDEWRRNAETLNAKRGKRGGLGELFSVLVGELSGEKGGNTILQNV
jgi:hypothetical protein